MKHIHTINAPNPAGHYSQAVVSNGFVFVSGLLPIDPENGQIPSSIEEQVHQVIDNLEAILFASGSSLQNVVKSTIYVPDISLWPVVNEIYASRFGDHKPARAVVPIRDLHFGCLLEIEAIAEIGQETPTD